MSATLRTSAIRRGRKRHEKRRKLRSQIARATGAERSAFEAKLQKTYPVKSAVPSPPPKAGRS